MDRSSKSDDGRRRDRSVDGLDEGEAAIATPDEHTRLLPNRVDSTRGLLTPDDPAVSPYNLWTVRILRYVTILFTVVTFVWWALLLVSTFATPPGLHQRGSNFYAFSFASVALVNLLFALLFFGFPAKSVRIVTVAMSVVLLLDMILILSVEKTRYEEGWVGTVSVVWSLLMSLWALLADRTVKWGKQEEEERLTGRAETRRTVGEWLAVLVSTIAYTLMLVAAVLITMTIILRAVDASLAAPGKLYWVDGGKYRIHLYCHGEKKIDAMGAEVPTVLFEGGDRPVAHGLWQLADDAVNNGSISRYCFADRPGFAWSETAPSPFSAGFATDVLMEALTQAGEQGPWILASAGIGSVYSRILSSRNGPEAVRGLLLMDPMHEDLLGSMGRPGRGFLLWLRGVVSPLGLDRLPGALLRGRSSKDRVYGRSSQQSPKQIFARLQESLVAGSFTKRELDSSREIQRKNTPLVVISSGKSIKQNTDWADKQRDLTKLTDNLKHWDIVDDAPHHVWWTMKGRDVIEKRLKQLVHGDKRHSDG